MPIQDSSGVVQIGEWVVHPALDSISRDTETQKLEPRMMRLLLCLANSAGAVISVDHLLTEVWADVVVGPASVYQTVSQLRKILGDVDPHPTYIATIPRKGYRLVAPVQRASAPAHTPHTPQTPVMQRTTAPPRRVWVVAGVLVAIALAAVYYLGDKAWLSRHTTGEMPGDGVVLSGESIAVLPFVNMSGDPNQEYFSDGLSEELIDHLVRSADLKVIARSSSFQFKGKNEDVRSIARKLGVAHVLEGSVRKVDQHLRIAAQLVNASDGLQMWSQTYDRMLTDIFKVQGEIADEVSQALHVALREGHRPAGREPDVQAYNLLLEGRYFEARRTLGDVEKAAELYNQAVDRDPEYALGWARLAHAYLIEETRKGPPSEEQNRRVLDALDRAIRLDPNLVYAYYTRAAFAMNITWDWAAALADDQRIRQIDSRSDLLPGAFGDHALVLGQVKRAIELYQEALTRNPLDPNSLDSLGIALCAANEFLPCLENRLRLMQLHPEFDGVNSSVGMARLYLGQFAEALAAMQQEPNENYRLRGLGAVFWAMGHRTESDVALKALTDKFGSIDPYGIASVHACRVEIDDAFRWLDRAYQEHNHRMPTVKTDPVFTNLRGDRRFQAILSRMKFTDQ
jgi:TolB-like protein/DNA-binding winged helix-turn-helix (wHTH) protein